jgi:GT2 family glycosyltransferase
MKIQAPFPVYFYPQLICILIYFSYIPIMALPTFTLVTPSFQQAAFLAETMDSVLKQNYPALEYIVMDGGSTDGSVDIITSRAEKLHYWQSEKDNGQYAAIADGFAKSDGEVMGWINSDDMLFPGTLHLVGQLFEKFPEVEWITSLLPVTWNKTGQATHVGQKKGFCKNYFMKGLNLSTPGKSARGCIQQESTFWRRSLWEKAGAGFDPEFPLAGDFDLWARFFRHAALVGVGSLLSGFRMHGDQRSITQRERYYHEALKSLKKHGGKQELGLPSWIRDSGLGACWPLRVLPSRGWVQPTRNIRWSMDQETWVLCEEWITQ